MDQLEGSQAGEESQLEIVILALETEMGVKATGTRMAVDTPLPLTAIETVHRRLYL